MAVHFLIRLVAFARHKQYVVFMQEIDCQGDGLPPVCDHFVAPGLKRGAVQVSGESANPWPATPTSTCRMMDMGSSLRGLS